MSVSILITEDSHKAEFAVWMLLFVAKEVSRIKYSQGGISCGTVHQGNEVVLNKRK